MSQQFSKKAVNKSINDIIQLLKNTDFLVTGVTPLDESGKNDVNTSTLEKVMDSVIKKYPSKNIMIISAGETIVNVLVSTQHGLKEESWVEKFPVGDNVEVLSKPSPENIFYLNYTFTLQGSETDETFKSSLKLKDYLNSLAFARLRELNLLEEESEELYFEL